LANTIEPQASFQNYPLLRALRYILVGAFGALIFSKMRAPVRNSIQSAQPQADGEKPNSRPVRVIVESGPPPTDKQIAKETHIEKREGRKYTLEKITALSVLGYAIITFFQWRAQINSLKVDQRAWAGLDKPMVADVINYAGPKWTWTGPDKAIHPVDTPNPMIHTGVAIKNFGKTPAFDVVVEVWAGPQEELDVNSKTECEFAEDFSSGKAIKMGTPRKGATWPTFGKTIFPGQEVTEPEDVPGGDVPRLFIVGCIAYRDAFNARHKTRFCYRSPQVLVTDPPMKNGDAFAQCNQYNDAN
jgi:hypothetical protein